MKASKNAVKVSGSLVIGLLALACGSAANPSLSTQVSQLNCGTGLVAVNNTCMTPAVTLNDFQNACQAIGLFDPSARTCSFRATSSMYVIPVLQPNLPSGPYAVNTQLPVKAGDQVTVTEVIGEFQLLEVSQGQILTTYRCNQTYDLNGLMNGTQASNGGLNSGLVGSDGTKVFFLGASGNATIQTNGKLLLGINAATNQLCSGGFAATVIVKWI